MTTQTNLDQISTRIERAYQLRHPNWLATGLTPGVWTAAAVRLHEVALAHPGLPIDPELYVAVQPYKTFRRDPWQELTQEGAAQVYRASLRKIVQQLKQELNSELRWSSRFLNAGRSFDELIGHQKSKVSPIIKLMLCHQHNRPDLAALVRPAAEAQHLACPLYRTACKHLISTSEYPQPDEKILAHPSIAAQAQSFAWN